MDLGKNNKSSIITTLLFLKRFNKPFYRTVIGLFHIIGKETGRQFVILPMVMQTLAAIAFSGTGCIGAITM